MRNIKNDSCRRRWPTALLLAAILLISCGTVHPSGADAPPFRINVVAEPVRVTPDGRFHVHIEASFDEEYRLYAHKTTLTPPPVEGIRFDNLQTDKPAVMSDPYLGDIAVFDSPLRFIQTGTVDKTAAPGMKTLSFRLHYQACTENSCLMPGEKTVEVPLHIVWPSEDDAVSPPSGNRESERVTENNTFRRMADRFGLMGVLLMAIGIGFLTSLTPCVYPMIPVTISVVASKSDGDIGRGFALSLLYVLGLSATYAVFGGMAAASGSLFGAYAGHPVVRMVVAGVFILMALGMFDVFFVQTPSMITHRLGTASRSGLWGVFLTGAASGAVVGPCVGPIVVSLLLYIAESGGIFTGVLIMWCFAMGMGVLFLIIGTFSGAATALPRAGVWMGKIKQFFGFVLLVIALFYLKPLLSPDMFHLLAIALAVGVGLFLGSFWPFDGMGFGLKRLVRGGWLVMAVLLIALGFRWLIGSGPILESAGEKPEMEWIFNEREAMAMADKTGRPVLIDFYAGWCAACKRLDRGTFSNAEVIRESRRFIALKIDVTHSDTPEARRLIRKYRVVGLPTVLFVDKEGEVLRDKTITAYIPPKDMIRRMRTISGPDAD